MSFMEKSASVNTSKFYLFVPSKDIHTLFFQYLLIFVILLLPISTREHFLQMEYINLQNNKGYTRLIKKKKIRERVFTKHLILNDAFYPKNKIK